MDIFPSMGLFDVLKQIISVVKAIQGGTSPDLNQSSGVSSSPTEDVGQGVNRPSNPTQPASLQLPDRIGTFLIPDVYPEDLGGSPPFQVLPGLHVSGKEVVGCIVKASEGTGWGAQNERWFERSWRTLGELASPQFFRGCYHFLRFTAPGAAQADYLCDMVERAGGWGPWDMMPWVDIEEGGQGHWAPGPLEGLSLPEKEKLAQQVTTCVEDFVRRFKQRTGLRIAVYGRGLFRDLGMRSCMFGADAASNPAYTAEMPREDQYGIPLDKIIDWQVCGDGVVYDPGFPPTIPGWGKSDYSVYVDGAHPTSLSSLRTRCLARAGSA